MKHAYSTFSSGMWRVFKEAHKDRSSQSFVSWWASLLSQLCKDGCVQYTDSKQRRWKWRSNVDPEILHAEMACLYLWKFKPLEHYFLDAGLAEFLVSAVKDFTPAFCRKLPCADRSPDNVPQSGSWETGVSVAKKMSRLFAPGPVAFALHFPAKERQRSVVVFPDSVMFDPRINAIRGWFFSVSDGVDIANMQLEAQSMGDCDWICRLVFGFSLYIEAFPNVVVPAGADTCKIGHYNGTHKSVLTSEVARRENENASVSPHFRRGHFRVLSSDKFTNKQGQVVFVKGCFVRGKAYEVLGDEK